MPRYIYENNSVPKTNGKIWHGDRTDAAQINKSTASDSRISDHLKMPQQYLLLENRREIHVGWLRSSCWTLIQREGRREGGGEGGNEGRKEGRKIKQRKGERKEGESEWEALSVKPLKLFQLNSIENYLQWQLKVMDNYICMQQTQLQLSYVQYSFTSESKHKFLKRRNTK